MLLSSRQSKLAHVVCERFRCRRFLVSQALLATSPDTRPSTRTRNEFALGDLYEVAQNLPKLPSVVADGTVRPPKKARKEKSPSSNPLEPNQVDKYLASLRTAGLEPTLVDIEHCQPSRHSHPESPAYGEEYRQLRDRLVQSFSKDQLRRFGEMYHLKRKWTRQGRRKMQYAEAIIEQQWKWPSLVEVQRDRDDRTKEESQCFPVTPSQLFLMLGKDGVDLLQMSVKYNVHMSLKPSPLELRVKGLQGAMRHFTEAMNKLKTEIVEEIFELPTGSPIRDDLLQRISRLAGAFIENMNPEGKVRICAKNTRQLISARRLVTRAACEVQELSETPILTYMPPGVPSATPIPTSLFPQTYSLYPFLSPRSLPWIMNTSGAFRIRRVGEWLDTGRGEDVQKTGGLAEGRGRLLTTSEYQRDLRDVLLSALLNESEGSVSSSPVVSASLGHMLVTSNTRATIVPPLKGYWPISKILRWMENRDAKAHYVPSLPSSLLNSAPRRQAIVHRLLYHGFPSNDVRKDLSNMCHTSTTNVLKFEIALAQPKAADDTLSKELTSGQNQERLDDANLGSSTPISPRCWYGRESLVDVMMPDRPMDIRFSLFDSINISPEQLPPELEQYTKALGGFLAGNDEDTQPDPPLKLTCRGDEYILNSSMSVRQSIEAIMPPGSGSSVNCADNRPHFHAVCESVLDLESNQKYTTCRIDCGDYGDMDSWKEFLTTCDHLSTATYRPVIGVAPATVEHTQ